MRRKPSSRTFGSSLTIFLPSGDLKKASASLSSCSVNVFAYSCATWSTSCVARGAYSVRNCAATSLSSLPSAGLVCMNTPLTCSMTPGTTASQSCVDPLSTMSSLASARPDGVGSCADASPVNIAMVTTTAAARTPRASLCAVMNSLLPCSPHLQPQLRPLDDAHAVRTGNDRGLGQPDEQPVL